VTKITEDGIELSRDQIEKLQSAIPSNVKATIEDRLLEYIRSNMNHLPMYYIPGAEFP
jgi:hypothetical protein